VNRSSIQIKIVIRSVQLSVSSLSFSPSKYFVYI